MPEMLFDIVWPDGTSARCYSPSLVVKEHLQPDTRYGLHDFVARAGTALDIASARVQAKFGMPCTRAIAQKAAIERTAAGFAADSTVIVRGFDETAS